MMTDDCRLIEGIGFMLFMFAVIALAIGLITVPNPKLSGVLIILMIIGIGALTFLIGRQIPISRELKCREEVQGEQQ